MKRHFKGAIRLILALAIIAGAMYLGYISTSDIKLGLDLNGGVSITYKSQTENPDAEQMSDAVYKLQLKAQDYSQEAEVYQEGNDRINIDIPGVSDATTILTELGRPGNLYFVEGMLSYPIATISNATASNIVIGEGVDVDIASLSNVQNVYYDYEKPPTYEEDQIVLSGYDITHAKGGMYNDTYGGTQYIVELVFSEEGSKKFAEATARNIGNQIHIIYNGDVISSPVVQASITEGRAQITGMQNLEEADRLASTIRIGALPIQLEELRSNVVGAKLGTEAISTSLKAGAIGFGIVCLFMIIVYLIPGIAASLALSMYVGLMLFLLSSFQITLTLPGIAGIILSVGMAVDANVIIFTRIKEEIGLNKSTKVAIKEGYSKALSAILDGNITTLIAAVVLFIKGTGSIKGFASTLALGVVLSMFTALFVTKFILNALYALGFHNEKFYGKKEDKNIISFISFRKITYAISIILIVVGLAGILVHSVLIKDKAFNYGLDFSGGSSTNVTFNEDLSINEIDQKVVPIFEKATNSPDIQTQKVAGTNEVIIKTRTLSIEERDEIYSTLATRSEAGGFDIDQSLITTENISGAVSTQMKNDALIAVIIATILMLIYIWFRFKDIKFAGAAILALLHDVLVTLGFYAIFRLTVDSTFIACMLTIVGYSINATIVIFDRIRENQSKLRGTTINNIVNTSISQTFSRSINTSLTTLIMVIVLYIMGVSSIKAFALPLIVGLVCGCYSSICITGTLWYDLKQKSELQIQNTGYKNNNEQKENTNTDVVKKSKKNKKKKNK
ncbi:MAG: protein translocase subunit SecD [Eubacteriales bacterium]|nr:protein translocase subunit SecD [Eubacteriales bacterium]